MDVHSLLPLLLAAASLYCCCCQQTERKLDEEVMRTVRDDLRSGGMEDQTLTEVLAEEAIEQKKEERKKEVGDGKGDSKVEQKGKGIDEDNRGSAEDIEKGEAAAERGQEETVYSDWVEEEVSKMENNLGEIKDESLFNRERTEYKYRGWEGETEDGIVIKRDYMEAESEEEENGDTIENAGDIKRTGIEERERREGDREWEENRGNGIEVGIEYMEAESEDVEYSDIVENLGDISVFDIEERERTDEIQEWEESTGNRRELKTWDARREGEEIVTMEPAGEMKVEVMNRRGEYDDRNWDEGEEERESKARTHKEENTAKEHCRTENNIDPENYILSKDKEETNIEEREGRTVEDETIKNKYEESKRIEVEGKDMRENDKAFDRLSRIRAGQRIGEQIGFCGRKSMDKRLHILALTLPVGRASQSHYHILIHLSEQLVKLGHRVTMPIHRHMERKSSLINTVYYNSALTSSEWQEKVMIYMTELVYGNVTLDQITKMLHTTANECDAMFADEKLKLLLTSEKYDVVIVDHFFTCGFLLAKKMLLPVVVLECTPNQSPSSSINPHPLSYVPVDMSGLTHRMSFTQRVQNMLLYWANVVVYPRLMLPPFQAIQEKYNISPGLSIVDIIRQAPLWILNQCWALTYPRPLLPQFVLAGAMLTKPAKPLEEPFASIYSAAGNAGVIVISFGSYITLKGIPDLESAILWGLADLPQTVIYRAQHHIPNTPANVVVMDHLPQNDLFGHPKTKALVLHGGLNGIYEAIYHAIPTLVIPFGVDTIDTAVRMKDKGMALYITPYDVTAERIRVAMLDLLHNQTYSKRAQSVSELLRDRPQHPLGKAAFWVEHIVRHKEEIRSHDYLHPAGNDLNIWQLYMVDVLAVCFFVNIFLIIVIYKLIKYCLTCIRCL